MDKGNKSSPNFSISSYVSLNGAYISITALIHPKQVYIHVKNPLFGSIISRLRMYKVFLGAVYAKGKQNSLLHLWPSLSPRLELIK